MALSTSRTVVTNTGLSTHDHFRVRDLISVGVATFSNFKTGSTNVHSVGVEAAGINVLGGDTPIGAGATIYDDGGVRFVGVVTATTFSGSGASLTNLNASNIASGTVPTARLGSGTASSSTFLRGDSTFQTVNTDLVSDTSPQLGGNLDTNSKNIVFGDSSGTTVNRLTLGGQADMKLFHNGTDSVITNATGDLYVNNNADIIIKPANDLFLKPQDGENGIKVFGNGAVELYFNNVMKITTLNNGARVNGDFVINDGSQLQLQNPNANRSSEIVNGESSTNSDIQFKTNGSHRVSVTKDGHFEPATNNAYDLGTSSYRWRNVYTNDLNLSNEGSTNSVDNTWGNYTIQEGESDLFLINNRNGKKYKFNLTEVS